MLESNHTRDITSEVRLQAATLIDDEVEIS